MENRKELEMRCRLIDRLRKERINVMNKRLLVCQVALHIFAFRRSFLDAHCGCTAFSCQFLISDLGEQIILINSSLIDEIVNAILLAVFSKYPSSSVSLFDFSLLYFLLFFFYASRSFKLLNLFSLNMSINTFVSFHTTRGSMCSHRGKMYEASFKLMNIPSFQEIFIQK